MNDRPVMAAALRQPVLSTLWPVTNGSFRRPNHRLAGHCRLRISHYLPCGWTTG